MGYASHPDRVLRPMVRESTDDLRREVEWDEALDHTAARIREIQAAHGRASVGAITSSKAAPTKRSTPSNGWCARPSPTTTSTPAPGCHSSTGYGLKTTFGTSAGTQDFKSVEAADVILLIGSNPSDAHPVFASRMKRRLREGARLVVADPRRLDLLDAPHTSPSIHLQPASARTSR
ncbi:MAG: molybdopterin-dependent oxidoreductase [Ilumatobacteraceae bacterium]